MQRMIRMVCILLLAVRAVLSAQDLPLPSPSALAQPSQTAPASQAQPVRQSQPANPDLVQPSQSAIPILSQTEPANQALPQPASSVSPSSSSPSSSTSSAPPSEPVLKQNPLTELRNFEPAADSEYRLGRGDAISVDFAGHPEMQAKQVVGPDGRISLPLAGDVMVADLTRIEAAKAIETALAGYYTNLSVQVTVTLYTSNRVLLLGAVEHPGIITFDGTPTLLETITRGGVLQYNTTRTGQIPEQCAIYRGNDQVIWVNLRDLIESGNALANLRLRRDDVVYVPSLLERYVSVLGEVLHPGAIALLHNSTLASVLADAGGITDHAGNNPRIHLMDPSAGTTQVLTYKQIMDPVKSREVTLKPGEIVYVPKSGFYRATYIVERLNPAITVMSIAYYAGAL